MSTAPEVRIPTDEELQRITRRAVIEIIPEQEFIQALKSGRQLRLKMGFDPSRPDMHIGHAIGLRKLRQLQDLGHQVVVIVGDWTGRIGDPSGQSQTRPMLTEEEVEANAETYLRQVYRIVDREKTEVLVQSSWFDRFDLEDVIRLSACFTVAQMLRREDFAQRYESHRPIGLHEFMYPLLQAYDSVEVRADVEFGGSDQRFNLLLGRELQEMMGQRPQSVFIMPLLVGTDGVQKMSKSLNNYIAVEDPPGEMYGKVMSIPDTLILNYFTLATDVPDAELQEISEALEKRSVNPMELKMRLAREIVAQFYDAAAAQEAEEGFRRTFSKRQAPEDLVTEYRVSFSDSAKKFNRPVLDVGGVRMVESLYLPKVLVEAGMVPSVSEAKRLIKQGAIDIDGDVHTSEIFALIDGLLFRVGKRRFLRIVDADKQADSSLRSE